MDHLRCLRVFTQVIADGSFAKAARTLDLAPAVVTRSIADLEEHLGARLVNRSTRSLALTDIGEAYLESAQRVLAELDDADALAGASTAEPSGVLRVLCPPAFAIHQLAHHLPRFRKLYPRIVFEIATPGPVDAADDSFDVSILSIGQQPLHGEFVARPLATSTFILCAASGYLDQHGHPQTPDELQQHTSLVPDVSARAAQPDAVPANTRHSRGLGRHRDIGHANPDPVVQPHRPAVCRGPGRYGHCRAAEFYCAAGPARRAFAAGIAPLGAAPA
jgi:DNA-binding transcriptional LysR family regulator